MDIGIEQMSVEGAELEFVSIFPDAEWFLTIIKEVKEMQKNNVPVTDVLIRENSHPLFGILKNFYPMIVKGKDGVVVKPSRKQILSFVESFFAKQDMKSVIEEKRSVDFSILFYGKGNLRINFSRDANGYTLNVRILDFVIPTIEDVKYPDLYTNFLKSLVKKTQIKVAGKDVEAGILQQGGLILHAGPTGSGKTTSVAAELDYFAKNTSGLIITYENPIEYRMLMQPKIRQIELFTHLERDSIYYHFLRNSPMIGMISEIKTKNEFIEALDLASRGHLVITTIHANNALEGIYMFLSSVGREFTPMFLSSLRALVCHRLVLNQQSKIVPLYEILIPDDVIKKKIEDWEFKTLENFLYKDRQVSKSSFMSFQDSLEERVRLGLLTVPEKEKLKGGF